MEHKSLEEYLSYKLNIETGYNFLVFPELQFLLVESFIFDDKIKMSFDKITFAVLAYYKDLKISEKPVIEDDYIRFLIFTKPISEKHYYALIVNILFQLEKKYWWVSVMEILDRNELDSVIKTINLLTIMFSRSLKN